MRKRQRKKLHNKQLWGVVLTDARTRPRTDLPSGIFESDPFYYFTSIGYVPASEISMIDGVNLFSAACPVGVK